MSPVNDFSVFMRFLPLLIPVLILEIILLVVALIDLVKREHTNGPKWLWALIVIFVNIIGPILYLIIGRKDE